MLINCIYTAVHLSIKVLEMLPVKQIKSRFCFPTPSINLDNLPYFCSIIPELNPFNKAFKFMPYLGT